MMIVDIKTALDRYLTQSLACTLDRQLGKKFRIFFAATQDDPTAQHVQKKQDGTRAHDGRKHLLFKTLTYTAPT